MFNISCYRKYLIKNLETIFQCKEIWFRDSDLSFISFSSNSTIKGYFSGNKIKYKTENYINNYISPDYYCIAEKL